MMQKSQAKRDEELGGVLLGQGTSQCRAVGRSENAGGGASHNVMGIITPYPLVEIGLTKDQFEYKHYFKD